MLWRVFYSYSHRNAELRERLATYLAPLTQQKKIVEWHDRKIEAGADWEREISDRLDSTHLILLLVSEDFLASDYCFGVEVEKALARLKRGTTGAVLTVGSSLDGEGITSGERASEKRTVRKTLTVATHCPPSPFFLLIAQFRAQV